MICLGGVKAEEPEIDISAIKYTNDFENGEAVNVVPSGKNGSTEYSFRIFDDDDDFPDDWEEQSFDDSDWDVCLLYTSPSPRDGLLSRMPSSA